MVALTGHIKDRQTIIHKQIIRDGNYSDGIAFEIELDIDTIDQSSISIDISDNLIVQSVNKKYNTDFLAKNVIINPLQIKKSSVEIINSVNDDILSYQYDEASRLLELGFFLGSACVFGVTLERVCLLICEKNKRPFTESVTELGKLSRFLNKNSLISDADFRRLSATSKFRNLSSHSNGKAFKTDAEQIRATVEYLVTTYLQSHMDVSK